MVIGLTALTSTFVQTITNVIIFSGFLLFLIVPFRQLLRSIKGVTAGVPGLNKVLSRGAIFFFLFGTAAGGVLLVLTKIILLAAVLAAITFTPRFLESFGAGLDSINAKVNTLIDALQNRLPNAFRVLTNFFSNTLQLLVKGSPEVFDLLNRGFRRQPGFRAPPERETEEFVAGVGRQTREAQGFFASLWSDRIAPILGIGRQGEAVSEFENQVREAERVAEEALTRQRAKYQDAASDAGNALLDFSRLSYNLQYGFNTFFDSLIDGTASVSEAFRALAADILRSINRALVVEPVSNILANALSGFASGLFTPRPTPSTAGPGILPLDSPFPGGAAAPAAGSAAWRSSSGGASLYSGGAGGGDFCTWAQRLGDWQ